MEYYDVFLDSAIYWSSITLIRMICDALTKRLSDEGGFLSIKMMKRRAFYLRLLIDSSKNKKKREKAIREYVSLIERIG